MNVLIVGLGIGQVYKEQLIEHAVVTVDKDPTLHPNFVDVSQAIPTNKPANYHHHFDVGIICTPNFTHKEIAYQIASHCKVVVVEKPGLQTAKEWSDLCSTFPTTKILMAKNNLFRPQNRLLRDVLLQQETSPLEKIEITWNNKSRIPRPGSWFTTKEFAWGGVSRDLMPHVLHMAENLVGPIMPEDVRNLSKKQNWDLDYIKICGTDYGPITPNGTYDVDDFATLTLETAKIGYRQGVPIECTVNWKCGRDEQTIRFFYRDQTSLTYDFGLCPNYVYGKMIDAFTNMNDYEYQRQMLLDTRIHEILELFDED